MKSIVRKLLDNIESEDKTLSENSVTEISFLLEMHSWNLTRDDRSSRYGSLTSQNLIEIEIDEDEQLEIVCFLRDAIAVDNDLNSGLIFAMGQSPAKLGLIPAIQVTERYLAQFGEDEFYQVLVSLERLLFFDESLSLEEKSIIIRQSSLLKLIAQKVLSLQPILHSSLGSTALRFLSSLLILLDK